MLTHFRQFVCPSVFRFTFSTGDIFSYTGTDKDQMNGCAFPLAQWFPNPLPPGPPENCRGSRRTVQLFLCLTFSNLKMLTYFLIYVIQILIQQKT
jgi:hypothetical protein